MKIPKLCNVFPFLGERSWIFGSVGFFEDEEAGFGFPAEEAWKQIIELHFK